MDIHATVKTLKQHKQGQISKIQLKAEAEIELLEYMRDYMAKRSEIEAQYCKNLERLSKGFGSKKFRKVFGNLPPMALSMADGPGPSKVIYAAFATLIAESEKQAKARGNMSEKMEEDLTKVIKEFNKEKIVSTKMLMEYGTRFQLEFIEAYEDLDKAKQLYDKMAKDTEASQKKYEDMLNRPKTAFGSLKVMITGKDVEERKKKWKTNARKLTDARNDYLLAVEGINVLQASYYGNDLPNLMKRLDGTYYPTVSGLFTKYSAMEEAVSTDFSNSINLVKSRIPDIRRERDTGEFLQDYVTIFETPAQFSFEKYPSDDSNSMTVNEVTKILLGRKLGEMMVKEEEISSVLSVRERELEGLQKMANVYSATPSFGDASSTAQQEYDVQTDVDVMRFRVSRLHTKMRVIQNLGVEPIMPILPNASPAKDGTTSASATNSRGKAVALYDYEVQGVGELAIKEGEELTVVQGEVDGWIKVKNSNTGDIGLVPSNYVNLVTVTSMLGSLSRQGSTLPELPSASGPQMVQAVYDYDATEDGELSYQAGDQIEVTAADANEEWWEGKVVRTGKTGSFQILFTQGWESVQTSRPGMKRVNSRKPSVGKISFGITAKVLYDYAATCDGELTLTEGETITITSKATGSPDWWEGKGSHGKGQFPSAYVQEEPQQATAGLSSPTRGKTVSAKPPSFQAKAIYDYTAVTPEELSIAEGDVIKVTDALDSDWWTGEVDGRSGTFPANYVERL